MYGSWFEEVGGVFSSAPGVTRTPGQRFRKPLLYPPELRGQITTRLNARYVPGDARPQFTRSIADPEVATSRSRTGLAKNPRQPARARGSAPLSLRADRP